MNVPNRLTVLRMVITPIFLAVFLAESIPNHFLWGLLIYGVGCFTDFLDGKIARKQNIVTVFGQFADPVADKMLTTSALLALMQLGLCSIWIILVVLVREFAVTSMRLIASAQGIVIPANIWGKLKTVSQMVFTLVFLLCAHLRDCAIIPADFNLPLVSNIALGVTAVLAVLSGVIYIKDAAKVIDINAK
ncbi:MAG: CDP-diacylglycerol--glycerol-3-phosphate 3-phosphatidyltransferase [Clostridia bacterium]|nr:CDP-diacylglycerol--glycerol-3-phosphate 3-phosphatidyltransferase [Clostridia bacterium]